MIDKALVQKHFSKSALSYDQNANVQKKMANVLIAEIRQWLGSPLSILDLGCGTGYLTQRLVDIFPTSKITAVDISPGMLKIAEEKLSAANIEFIRADIEELELTQKFDLIVSNATFQWFNQPANTLRKMLSWLNENGVLSISTFGSNTFTELHCAYNDAKKRLGISKDYSIGQSFPSFLTFQELCNEVLEADGHNFLCKCEEEYQYEYHPSVKEFLGAIKKIGATNSNMGHNFNNVSLLKEMMKIYEQDFSSNGKIQVTYHCMFFRCTKIKDKE